MLRKMRWRFIGAAMAAFMAVVLTLLCVVNVWNFRSAVSEQDETLQRLLELEHQQLPFSPARGEPPFERMEKFSAEVPYMIRFFSVYYDTDGRLVRVGQDYIASISADEAEQYAEHVRASGRERGYYNGYRYLAAQTRGGSAVFFLNAEKELRAARSLLFITLAIAGGCLAVVFGLVVLFSGRAIAPYLRNLEAQKQFITNASHELKTPLTAISTSADVLAMEHGEDEWVQNIRRQAGRLSRLVADLITLSRLDEEKPFPVQTQFSLSEALWESAEPFASLAQAQGKTFSQQIEDGLLLTGDRTAVQQMVSILLDNALKYTPSAGSIGLCARRGGKHIEIVVKNTCTGTPPDTKRLFERFYRADPSRTEAGGGTGIGLSIARATAQAHGGSISAELSGGYIVFRVCL